MTIRCQEPVAIEHVSVSGWPVRPGTGNFEPEAYLGARIIVADEVYGTLSFSRSDPYPGKFSPADKDFLQLMAEWVGQELARSQAEETLRESQEALRRRTGEIIHIQNVLLELAKSDMSDWEKVIRTITERGAKALDVERVSVWLFNADRSEILCADLYHLSAGIHRKGSRLRAADYPSYFRALESSTVVAADDARADARTREFAGTYLEPLGITSMMDAAVQRDGKVVGVVCHEHTGPKREWTVEEQNFAMSAAEFVSLALEARERKKAEDEAERTHEALRRSREELRRLAGRLLTAMEEERRHVSRELHDDLNQKLAVLTVEAEALERTPSVAQAGIQDSLRHLRARIAALSDDVRHLAYQLHPSILDHLGLPAALKSFVDEFGKRERIKVRLTLKGLRGSLPQSVALCLYRVTQEALRNVAKHAQATRAVVRLTGNRGEVCLSITDNGVGDPSNPTADRRHGLGRVSMEERVRLVNGTFTVSSQPGRGTTVTARIPLSAES
jgi:signal transduction histidine kinase